MAAARLNSQKFDYIEQGVALRSSTDSKVFNQAFDIERYDALAHCNAGVACRPFLWMDIAVNRLKAAWLADGPQKNDAGTKHRPTTIIRDGF
jgi:hypothetical protein